MSLARRWLAQARNFQAQAESAIAGGHWAGACFNFQQAVEHALKAVLLLRRGTYPNTHSVRRLLAECAQYDAAFSHLTAASDFLSAAYTAARYVDASDPAVLPFMRYSEADAVTAAGYAAQILALAEAQFANAPPDAAS